MKKTTAAGGKAAAVQEVSLETSDYKELLCWVRIIVPIRPDSSNQIKPQSSSYSLNS